jgi:hypothetical protein
MKEATGELNMTVVTVVAIAAVAAFFYAFVWPSIKTSISSATKCSAAICPSNCTSGTCDCTYYDEDGTGETVKCKVEN